MHGYYDPDSVLKKLKAVGFKEMIMQGHVPKIIGVGSWEEKGGSFAMGFIKRLMASLRKK